MNLEFKKYGEMYIKSDMKYGFLIGDYYNRLYKFINLSENDVQTIVLPEINIQSKPYMLDEAKNGFIRIDTDCFKDIGNIDLIVPSNNVNVIMDPYAFKSHANVNFVLPDGMSVFFKEERYDAGYEFDCSLEIVIASKEKINSYFDSRKCRFYTLDEMEENMKYNFDFYFTSTTLNDFLQRHNNLVKDPEGYQM